MTLKDMKILYNILGDIMDEYHIFAIKKDIYNTYKNNSKALYQTLYNLYKMNKKDLKLGIGIYNQLCNIIDIKKIKQYIKLLPITRKTNNKYLIVENNIKTIIILKYSNIIYKQNNMNNNIIYALNSYYEYLFACDFENKEYYWLNDL